MKKAIFFISAITILLTSCAKKIDGSSDKAMNASIEEINKSLDEEKKEKFIESIKLVIFQEFNLPSLMQEGGAEKIYADIRSKLDGKTADDIIAEGDKIKAGIKEKKKE